MGSMKAGFLLGLIAILTISSVVHAESVNVKINNKVNSSTETEVNSSSHSRVEITTNGEKKVFESNGESINYESPDGNTSVKINTNGQTEKSTTQKTLDSVNEEVRGVVDEGKKKVEDKIDKTRKEAESKVSEEIEKQSTGLFEIIKNFFINLFNF